MHQYLLDYLFKLLLSSKHRVTTYTIFKIILQASYYYKIASLQNYLSTICMPTQTTQHRYSDHSIYYYKVMGFILVSYFMFLCFGHLIIPNYNEKIRFFMIIYLVGRTLTFLFGGLVTYSETNKVCEKAKNMNERSFNQDFRNNPQLRQIYHVIVLNTCEKDLLAIRQTLDRLRLHRGSNNYVVLLAHTNNLQKQDAELMELVQSNRNYFLILELIAKPIPAEANPFWFMQELQQKCVSSYNICVDKILLTVLDTHSWVPEVYIKQIEDQLALRQIDIIKDQYIYQPIEIYTINHLDVSFTTRIYNQLEVCLQANDCLSRYRPSLPKNNFSLDYSLAKRISLSAGHIYFNQDSILLNRIQSQIKVKQIYAPFNRLNLCIDGGHFSNTKITFDRIVEQAAKQLNLLYQLVSSFGTTSKWQDSLSIMYILVHISDKLLVILVLQTIHSQTFTLLLSKAFAPLNIENVSILLCIALMILTSVHFLCYQFAKRKASFILYGLTNKTIFDIFQFNILVGYIVVLFMLPAYVVSTFKAIFGWQRELIAVEDVKMDKPK